MKKITLTVVLLLISLVSFSQKNVGIQLVNGANSEFGIGAKSIFKFKEKINISSSINYYFGEDLPGVEISFLGINADVHYIMAEKEGFVLYPLAGLNLTRASVKVLGTSASNSELGINIGGGTYYNFSESLTAVFEAKYVVSDFDQFVVGLGVLYNW